MKKRTVLTPKKKTSKKKKFDSMRIICWIIIPLIMVGFITADALGIYPITKDNLIVICISLAVVLLPFFSEIKVKDLAVKRSKSISDKDT